MGSAYPWSIHPFSDVSSKPIDAASISLLCLHNLLGQNNLRCIEHLDFINIHDAIIKQLFVTQRHTVYSPMVTIYPPPNCCQTAHQICTWFKLGASDMIPLVEAAEGFNVFVVFIGKDDNRQ